MYKIFLITCSLLLGIGCQHSPSTVQEEAARFLADGTIEKTIEQLSNEMLANADGPRRAELEEKFEQIDHDRLREEATRYLTAHFSAAELAAFNNFAETSEGKSVLAKLKGYNEAMYPLFMAPFYRDLSESVNELDKGVKNLGVAPDIHH